MVGCKSSAGDNLQATNKETRMTNEEFIRMLPGDAVVTISETNMHTKSGWSIMWSAVVVFDSYQCCRYGNTRERAIDYILGELRLRGVIK